MMGPMATPAAAAPGAPGLRKAGAMPEAVTVFAGRCLAELPVLTRRLTRLSYRLTSAYPHLSGIVCDLAPLPADGRHLHCRQQCDVAGVAAAPLMGSYVRARAEAPTKSAGRVNEAGWKWRLLHSSA